METRFHEELNFFDSLIETLPSIGRAPSESCPRALISEILSDYNRKIGNIDEASLANCRKIAREGVPCIVAGQQLGYLGGPAFTLLKAITCVLAARDAGAVPIFWLATEDHDIPEIDHTYSIDEGGNIKKRRLPLPRSGKPVEDLFLTKELAATIDEHLEELGVGGLAGAFNEGDRYADAMARILVALMKGSGLLFLEPMLLRRLAIPLFHDELVEARQIRELLIQENGRGPIHFDESATNLFFKDDQGLRKKITFNGDHFHAGDRTWTLPEILDLVEHRPERFSPNVAARPILQNMLLPVSAQIVGPTELAYHKQLLQYHHLHGIAVPALVPRLSATIVPASSRKDLDKLGLAAWENLPENWAAWASSCSRGGDVKKMLAERGVETSSLHRLKNLIHPFNGPQERALNWLFLQSRSCENLVKAITTTCDWKKVGHYFLYPEGGIER